MMRNENNVLIEGWEKLAEKYWSGEPASDQPIWERLVEGQVTIWGLDLKGRALREIQRYWPKSLPLLSIAANSAAIGSFDGAIMPYAVRRGETLQVSYYLRMVDARNVKFCGQLEDFMRTGGGRVCSFGPIGGSLIIPDFSCYSFERRIDGISLIW